VFAIPQAGYPVHRLVLLFAAEPSTQGLMRYLDKSHEVLKYTESTDLAKFDWKHKRRQQIHWFSVKE
jgi:hypothetical protein